MYDEAGGDESVPRVWKSTKERVTRASALMATGEERADGGTQDPSAVVGVVPTRNCITRPAERICEVRRRRHEALCV